MDTLTIAKICHEVNRIYCESVGDKSQKTWDEAELRQKNSAIMGVEYALSHPEATPADQHAAWAKDKIANGWRYWPVKNATVKGHPCLVPYDELPEFQKTKDKLFQAVVKAAK